MQVRSLGQEDPQKKEMATHPVFLPGECSAKYAHNNMYFNSCLYINNIFSFRGLVTKSCLTLVTPWTVTHQTSLSMEFPRQEYWSGLPFASPGDLPDPGVGPTSWVLAGGFFTVEPPGKPTTRAATSEKWPVYREIQQRSMIKNWENPQGARSPYCEKLINEESK